MLSIPYRARPSAAAAAAAAEGATGGGERARTPAPVSAPQPDDAPAVRLLSETLREAARRNASDLHIEPMEHGWRVRLRIDGVLHEMARPPAHLRDAFVTRIKVLARMDIAERRIPQDGKLRLASSAASRAADDYRVNSLPTLHGEKLVLRRLEALPADLSLAELGLDEAQQHAVAEAIGAPHGLVLVTGPTGSGKTLSLYCFLQRLNITARNLCSVEDPAEIQLAGINQVNVREKAGLTFAVALRALLRQDPDVIMIGEIRDEETAGVAVRAAQTGHLVLSTVHTNDASAACARLVDIGVEPYNLAGSLRLVTAQRLVRRLCPLCRVRDEASPAALIAAGQNVRDSEMTQPYVARGCEACHGIGYRGRVGIHEVLPISEAIRELIVTGRGAHEIAREARRSGVATLRDAALARVRDGTTSLAEALAATQAP
ncbi:GspE/PulE family protein [Paraburkholderia silvatlantica]|uniref:GspE/PulE family protein n=1 Tax=Paraburkholderia silvatlantica TaxID=321895 RepID=UPI00105F9DA3|nr:GspE/PulE family protein [Paraburkholderia silvatlantica]